MVDWNLIVIVVDTGRWIGLGDSFGAGMNQYRGGSW
jgi:hypothetical protein